MSTRLSPAARTQSMLACGTQLFRTLALLPRVQPVHNCAYSGPSPEGFKLKNVECSLDQPNGLILEVAQSAISPEAGRGLFVRVAEGTPPVTLMGGTALCGYGSGQMAAERPERARGRYTEFRLIGCATVWFEGELTNACELLRRNDIDRIAGHEAVCSATGQLQSIRVDESYEARFFVPSQDAVEGKDLDSSSVGIMANDLAGGFTELYERGGYEAASAAANILVLVQGLQRDPAHPSTLVPAQPVPTICRTVVFENQIPMEVGISYGDGYWRGK